MIDRETKKRLADFFDPYELVELLDVKTEDVIDAFEIEVEDALDDLEELMGIEDDD